MRKCTKCEHEYADEFSFCPHCGEEYSVAVEVDSSAQTENQERVTILSKTKSGKKLVSNEQKNHYIQNSILLLFSLILFICSFFTGIIYQFNDNRLTMGSTQQMFSVPVYHNTLEHIEGTFSVIGNNQKTLECFYKSGVTEVYYEAIQTSVLSRLDKDSADYDKVEGFDWDTISVYMAKYINDDAFTNEIGQYVKKNTKTNLITCTIGRHRFYNSMQDQYVSIDNSTDEMYEIFITFGFASVAMELCFTISTFVFTLQALIALLKRTSLKRTFLMAVLPLIFAMVLLLLSLLSPIYNVSTVTFVAIALNMLFVVAMGIHEVLFVQRINTVNVQLLVKNAILFVLGAIACFVMCVALFEFEYTAGDRIILQITTTPTKMLNTISLLEKLDSNTTFLLMCLEFSYIALMICLITLMVSLCKRICDLDENQLIARSIVAIVFFIIGIIAIFVTNGQLNEKIPDYVALQGVTISSLPSVNMYVAFVAIVAIIVVNQAWNPQPKWTTNNLVKES